MGVAVEMSLRDQIYVALVIMDVIYGCDRSPCFTTLVGDVMLLTTFEHEIYNPATNQHEPGKIN